MDGVELTKFIEALNKLSGSVQAHVNSAEDRDKVTSSLTKKVDELVTELTPKKKTKIQRKIEELGKTSTKTEEHLGKLNETLSDIRSLMQDTKKLSTTQKKIMERMDPGGRRLKGDTYDASQRSQTKQLTRAIKKSSSFLMRNPITSAVGGAVAYKPLKWLWDNKLMLSALGLGGAMNPDTLKQLLSGEMNWRNAAFGEKGGYGKSGITDWMLNNPGKTLGGAAAYGTNFLGTRSLIHGTARLGAQGALWAGSKTVVPLARAGGRTAAWAYGGGMGSAINRSAGGMYLNRFLPTGAGGMLPPGATGMPGPTGFTMGGGGPAKTPQTLKSIWQTFRNTGSGKAGKRIFKKAALDATRRGATKQLAISIGKHAAARFFAGLAAAPETGGLATIAIWGMTIGEILNMIAAPVADWWIGSLADMELRAKEDIRAKALAARDAGLVVQDPVTKQYLSHEEFARQNTLDKISKDAEAEGPSGWVERITGTHGAAYYKRQEARKQYLKVFDPKRTEKIGILGARTTFQTGQIAQRVLGESKLKSLVIEKILALSDGKQFIGRVWTKKSLREGGNLAQLQELYRDVVLPRATGEYAQQQRTTLGYKTETGMKLKGTRAEVRKPIDYEVGKDPDLTAEENEAWKKAVEEQKQREADELYNVEGFGGATTLKMFQDQHTENRAQTRQDNRQLINALSKPQVLSEEEKKFHRESLELSQKLLTAYRNQDPSTMTPAARSAWERYMKQNAGTGGAPPQQNNNEDSINASFGDGRSTNTQKKTGD